MSITMTGRRDVAVDTETTGFDPGEGHRVVEVACVELVNYMPTGRELHFYCNPDRDMPQAAEAVHGLSESFLRDKPRFEESVEEFLGFMAGASLVAHNAEFDMRFLQAELVRCHRPKLTVAVIDTLAIARQKFPGSPASLDALCRRFGIDLSERTKHGALIDTRLLAKVYLELMGGQQPDLGLSVNRKGMSAVAAAKRSPRPARPHAPSAQELADHGAMVAGLKASLWVE